MKLTRGILSVFVAVAGLRAQEFIDRVDDALTVSAAQTLFRARLSGTLELEGYRFQQPAPGLIYAGGTGLFNPRLTFFVDAQWGPHIYAFLQSRVDRGFDPSDEKVRMRLDEYAVRLSAADGRLNLQLGKFATIVGSWVPRHGAWDNPFVTAPLPYENPTGIWNIKPAPSGAILRGWAHLLATSSPVTEYTEKPLRTPLIWGPSYATGAAVFGEIGRFAYAAEIKNGGLASHPGTWDPAETQWQHPAFSGRADYRPNAMWNFGVSASTGPYLRADAAPLLPAGFGLDDYRERVLAQDIGFAWHHLQLWAEIFEARFVIPNIGDADTVAYYVEAKYKFTPQFFGSLRWNQQVFGTLPTAPGINERWGRDVWRIDVAPAYRFTPHTQFKLQYSFQSQDDSSRRYGHTVAAQFVLRF